MWLNRVPDSYRVGQRATLQNIQDGGMACLQVKAAVDDAIVVSGLAEPETDSSVQEKVGRIFEVTM